jgi:trans-aconitate 2-methyltransferase
MVWEPERYHRFREERFLPFEDLVAMIRVRAGMRVVDLGCGTGELTERLAGRLPGSDVLGIDSSETMLELAHPRARRGLRFEKRRIEDVEGTWDLVFSHAAIHWVEDHDTLVPRLWSFLAPGGALAVQQPSNHHHRAHAAVREVAGRDPFRAALDGWVRHSPVLEVGHYADLLSGLGAASVTVIEKVYPHVLEDADAVLEWNRGTVLSPYLERLPEELHPDFLETYRESLHALMPGSPVFYGYRRILFSAERPE